MASENVAGCCSTSSKSSRSSALYRGSNIQPSWVLLSGQGSCASFTPGPASSWPFIALSIVRHKYSIRDKLTQLPLTRHFWDKGHSISLLKYVVLKGINRNGRGGDRELIVRKREVNWNNFLNTIAPKGLNTDLDLFDQDNIAVYFYLVIFG